MLKLVIPEREYFNEEDQTFIYFKEQTLQLEHSLISLAKWESKWHIPFLDEKPKTVEQLVDYFKCMTLTQGIDDSVYKTFPSDIIQKINDYMNDSMTATTFVETNEPPSREVVTAEIIYYMMIKLGIPFECQKWHLSRLMTLIRVCALKSAPPKKMGRSEILAQNRELNEARKAKYKTKG